MRPLKIPRNIVQSLFVTSLLFGFSACSFKLRQGASEAQNFNQLSENQNGDAGHVGPTVLENSAGPVVLTPGAVNANSPNSVLKISSAQDLVSLAGNKSLWNREFEITQDIDLAQYYLDGGADFQIGICNSGNSSENIPFEGILRGQNHKISGYQWRNSVTKMAGMICQLGPNGKIYDLILTQVKIHSSSIAGALVGSSEGDIHHCGSEGEVSGGVQSEESPVGGLIGIALRGIVDGVSYSSARVSGQSHVGGLIGKVYYRGSLENAYALGDVNAAEGIAGGLIGELNGKISKTFSRGSVKALGIAGGLVGKFEAGRSNSQILDSYSVSEVTAPSCVSNSPRGCSVGGLVGVLSGSQIACHLPEGFGIPICTQVKNGDLDEGDLARVYSTGAVTVGENQASLSLVPLAKPVLFYTGGIVGFISGATKSAFSLSAVKSAAGIPANTGRSLSYMTGGSYASDVYFDAAKECLPLCMSPPQGTTGVSDFNAYTDPSSSQNILRNWTSNGAWKFSTGSLPKLWFE